VSDLLLSFYGDDFTGSTDALESLARAGVRTVLFTEPPTDAQLARHPDLRAFGVAGTTRSMPPDEMERTLRPALAALQNRGAPIVHYKVCSTFDSSPTIGSIGRVIEIGLDLFPSSGLLPIVAGAPALGRHCVFGNLFARLGGEFDIFRLDRHPSMSSHPTTPMKEADLRRHLLHQTLTKIGLLDVLAIEGPDPEASLDRILADGTRTVLIDLLYERQLTTVGRLLARHASREKPRFVIGSSGVEAALGAHWAHPPIAFEPAGDVGPIVVVCGSCSPVTTWQIQWAAKHGFTEVGDLDNATVPALAALREGRSVVVHSRSVWREKAAEIGPMLGRILRDLLSAAKVRRVVVAGGDTSGAVARELGIESMEMVAELTRGSPLCRVTAPNSPADGIEITFKGGQIGKVDFFGQVRKGVSDA
jgi:uncharacterized protein YgbK (DUF1537 family)